MKKQSQTTSHQQIDAQPVSEQQFPWKDCHSFIAEHDIMWHELPSGHLSWLYPHLHPVPYQLPDLLVGAE